MLLESTTFVKSVDIYFHCYLFFGIFFQLTLLFLILFKSPRSLHDLRIFLLNTTFSQILDILCAYFIQYRALPNSTSLAVLANGPCKLFGPNVCFSTYHIFVGISSSVAMSTSATILFRFLLIRNWQFTNLNYFTIILLSYFPPLIATVIPFTATWNFATVRDQTYQEHPTYNLSIYEPFPGFANTQSIQFQLATILIAIGAYGVPLGSIFLVRQIVKLIGMHKRMSQRTKSHTRTLVKGLALQTLLPLTCYIPIISLYMYSQTTGQEVLFTEHLLNILTCFPALIDPFLSFYFVVPYRIAIMRGVFHRKPIDTTNSIAFSSTLSARRSEWNP